jgi:predicted NAD-dependent protein-ADP-ribosyltransferase YbiA (DUF1768 family)
MVSSPIQGRKYILQKQNRYPSPFKATIKFPSAEREVTFPTAEHWMMTQKALLFGDVEVAEKVLAIKGSGHKECMKVKGLGREVRGFKEEVWVRERGNSFPRLSSWIRGIGPDKFAMKHQNA